MNRNLFIYGNVVLFLLFLGAMADDLVSPYLANGWGYLQRQYRQMQAQAETSPEAKASIQSRQIEIKQIIATDLGQVDRCTSCHQGMDSIATPTLENSFTENPFL